MRFPAVLACLVVTVAGCAELERDFGIRPDGSSAPAARAEASAPATASATSMPAPVAAPPPVRRAEGRRHMAATANPLATRAALDVLRRGGAAIDAAIAAQMVLNLVEPQSSGIGGGGFLMHFDARSGRIDAYDGRETAPAGATPGMFLDAAGKPRDFYDAVVGGLSVGVPGLLRMLELAHREHGRLPWAGLFAPAIEMAERGVPVSERLHGLIAGDGHLRTFAAARQYFYGPDGTPRQVGETLVNRRLAAALRAIAAGGADAFYQGAIARAIVAAVQGAARNPGTLTAADLAGYRAKKREAACLFYRAYLVCGTPPPSSGGVATLQILGMLQRFEMGALDPNSVAARHLIAEASRLAFADRNAYIADPDFVPVPAAGMLDPGYLDLRSRAITPSRSIGRVQPGTPGVGGGRAFAPDGTDKGVSTTHLSIVDEAGNAVALTSSIENQFGSRLMVDGFLLNNQLTDFSFRPEEGGAPVANRVEPGKRPRSSMAPTLVFDGSGRAAAALGSPGGSRIIGYVAGVLVALIDWNLDLQAAFDLPHVVNRNGRTELEKDTAAAALKEPLERLGHEIAVVEMTSGLHGVAVTPAGLVGAADPRREGVALGD